MKRHSLFGVLFLFMLSVAGTCHGGHRATLGRTKNNRVTYQITQPCSPIAAPSCAAPAHVAPAAVIESPPFVPSAITPSADAVASAAKAQTADEMAQDWQQLEGIWQRFETLPNGGRLRMEKTITGHHESLKMFAPNGDLLRDQTADIELSRSGDLRVMKWSNAKVVAGSGIGDKIVDGTAIYVFKNGQWISVIGLVANERWNVYSEAWSRVPPQDPSK